MIQFIKKNIISIILVTIVIIYIFYIIFIEITDDDDLYIIDNDIDFNSSQLKNYIDNLNDIDKAYLQYYITEIYAKKKKQKPKINKFYKTVKGGVCLAIFKNLLKANTIENFIIDIFNGSLSSGLVYIIT